MKKKNSKQESKFGVTLDPVLIEQLKKAGYTSHAPGMPGSGEAMQMQPFTMSTPRKLPNIQPIGYQPLPTPNAPQMPDLQPIPVTGQRFEKLIPEQGAPASASGIGSKGDKIGRAIGAVAGTVGDLAQGAFRAIPFLTSLLPEDEQRQSQYVPYAYNPYPNGTGASVLYEHGGKMPKGGKIKKEPVYVTDPKDPRLKRYQDSLYAANHPLIEVARSVPGTTISEMRDNNKKVRNMGFSPYKRTTYNRKEDQWLLGTKDNKVFLEPIPATPEYGNLTPMEGDSWVGVSSFKPPVQPVKLGRPAPPNLHPLPLASSRGQSNTPAMSTRTMPTFDEIQQTGYPMYGPNNGLIGFQQEDGSIQPVQNIRHLNTPYHEPDVQAVRKMPAGGSISGYHSSTRKEGGFTVTEEIPSFVKPEVRSKGDRVLSTADLPAVTPQPLPSPEMTAQPQSVTYEQLQFAGSPVYSPQFHGDWTGRQRQEFFNSAPQQIGDFPVLMGDQWMGVQQKSTRGPEWMPSTINPTSISAMRPEYDMWGNTNTNNVPFMEQGGNIEPGQEIELSEEEIKRLMKMGYTFSFE